LPSLGGAIRGLESLVPVQPALQETRSSTTQAPTSADANQLANRVYDIIVRRLTSERQRRGM